MNQREFKHRLQELANHRRPDPVNGPRKAAQKKPAGPHARARKVNP